jgi:hypothetical protein
MYTGWSTPTKKSKFLNAAQYKELFSAAAEHSDFGPLDPAAEFEAETGTTDWNSNNDVTWSDQAFQDGGITQYTLSLTGGDARTKFLISGSWNDQKGIVLGNSLNRANGRINLDHQVNSRLKLGLNLSLAKSENVRVPSDNAFTNPIQLNAIPPLHPLYGPDGKYNPNTLYYNNLIETEGSSNLNTTYRSISNINGQFNITPNLNFISQVGLDWIKRMKNNISVSKHWMVLTWIGYDGTTISSIFTATNTFNYRKTFNEDHTLEALAGMEYQDGTTKASNVTGRAFPSNKFTKIASAAIIESGSSTELNLPSHPISPGQTTNTKTVTCLARVIGLMVLPVSVLIIDMVAFLHFLLVGSSQKRTS